MTSKLEILKHVESSIYSCLHDEFSGAVIGEADREHTLLKNLEMVQKHIRRVEKEVAEGMDDGAQEDIDVQPKREEEEEEQE